MQKWTKAEQRGAKRLAELLSAEFRAAGDHLTAHGITLYASRLLDEDPDGCVFPAAAALPAIEDTPTLEAIA